LDRAPDGSGGPLSAARSGRRESRLRDTGSPVVGGTCAMCTVPCALRHSAPDTQAKTPEAPEPGCACEPARETWGSPVSSRRVAGTRSLAHGTRHSAHGTGDGGGVVTDGERARQPFARGLALGLALGLFQGSREGGTSSFRVRARARVRARIEPGSMGPGLCQRCGRRAESESEAESAKR
jgi:hypothetical protein